jgi:hypothetical protein
MRLNLILPKVEPTELKSRRDAREKDVQACGLFPGKK